jgi:alpha-N-acetylglucosamine transferase
MNTILTLKYGNKYTSADVNRIYDATDGKYNYVCVTDNPTGLYPDIYTIPTDTEIEGHWEKIKLFKLNNLGKILYLDLDIRIQNNLDHLFEMLDSNPIICYTYWKDKNFPYHKDKRWAYNYLSNFNSSVMLWEDARHIYDYWEKNQDYYMVKYAGDDRFLYHENFTFEHFPESEIYSFKFSGNKYKSEYTIALLNGQADFPDIEKEYDNEFHLHQMG